MKFKVKVTKKVTWDQEALKEVLSSMSPVNANHYAKITYHVEETKYNAATPDVRDLLQTCRTTEIGSFKVELEDQNGFKYYNCRSTYGRKTRS